MVESLRDEELQRYKESFEKLSRPNLEVYERMPMPGKVMAILDMRAQFGGKSVIWETAVTGGCVYVDVSPGLEWTGRAGLCAVSEEEGHCGAYPFEWASRPGSLEDEDLLYALPILGVERCVKDELETTSHPCWVCRWKGACSEGQCGVWDFGGQGDVDV